MAQDRVFYPTELDTHGPRRDFTFWQALKDLLYGLFFHEHVIEAYRMKAYAETLYLVVTLGDILGVPILSPYYSLRILPHVLPDLERWKRFAYREKDITDYA